MQEINWSQDSLLRKDSQDETFSVNTLTEENIGRAVESLPDDKKKLIFDIVEKVDIADSQSSIHYGAGAQSNISDFSNQILHQVQAKDSGYIGELVIDLSIPSTKSTWVRSRR
ncbi:MAG: toxic anion resistance protein [Oscillospiraceae bacterium]